MHASTPGTQENTEVNGRPHRHLWFHFGAIEACPILRVGKNGVEPLLVGLGLHLGGGLHGDLVQLSKALEGPKPTLHLHVVLFFILLQRLLHTFAHLLVEEHGAAPYGAAQEESPDSSRCQQKAT